MKRGKIYQALFQQELLGHRVHNASILESTGEETQRMYGKHQRMNYLEFTILLQTLNGNVKRETNPYKNKGSPSWKHFHS